MINTALGLLIGGLAYWPLQYRDTPDMAPASRPARAAMLALGETDLLVARQFCAGFDPAWLDNVSPRGKALILEQLSMMVAVDPRDTWHVRYQDFSVISEPGQPGDFAAMELAIADARFGLYRCLKFRELPPQLGSAPRGCDWSGIKLTLSGLTAGRDRDQLVEACGQAIQRLSDPEQRDLLQNSKLGEWAVAMLGEHHRATIARLENAANLDSAVVATADRVDELTFRLGALQTSKYLIASADNSLARDVAVFELGDSVKLFATRHDATSQPAEWRNKIACSMQMLSHEATAGRITVGIGEVGSDHVTKLRADQLQQIKQLLERLQREPAPSASQPKSGE